MSAVADALEGEALSSWIERFHDMVERNAPELERVAARTKVAITVTRALDCLVHEIQQRQSLDCDAMAKFLTSCKVLMRDRRGIECLLTPETLELFLLLAGRAAPSKQDWVANEEAIKCTINSIYSRPEFVAEHCVPKSFQQRLLVQAKRAGPASFHLLVWKTLLVAFTSGLTCAVLSIQTLAFTIQDTELVTFPHGKDRIDLALELLKLLAVMANAMKWTKEDEQAKPTIYQEIYLVGGLLLEILQLGMCDSAASPITDVRNKALEIFMVLPAALPRAFVTRYVQQGEAPPSITDAASGNSPSMDRIMASLVNHLHAMLVRVRVEKTRPMSDMVPAVVTCFNLSSSGDDFKTYFKQQIFPDDTKATNAPDALASPPQFLCKHLLFFLTCLDTDVRRCVGEWLYLLCDKNADEYTRRTGIGNAVGMLRIKGLA
ncbi:TPA: hypothetical protein N0F65_011434 [Lagenidium giganteum]|uniref:Uncharacterized protein n=1 Tax=Lagenidium giganteum TaxID=4803 RepID=A0AAV2Z9B9_9STRA|nr:TPA: hypothetical protein N0F65_011434 [Lagenidium giganteum]